MGIVTPLYPLQVGVKHLVVFLNKADIVDDQEVLELVSYIVQSIIL